MMNPTPFTSAPKQFALRWCRSKSFAYLWRRRVFWGLLTVFTLGFTQPTTANAEPCLNLLSDPGLEDITAWQTKSNDDFPLFSSLNPHTGESAAYLAGRNDAVDRLATTLELPAGRTITLSFWWQLQSEEEQRFADKLAVLALPEQARTPQLLIELSSRQQSTQWQQAQFDLSAWAGEAVQLQFLAQSDSALVTDFFIDDVMVIACPQTAATQ